MALACHISLSFKLYCYGLIVARNLNSVPMQKYDTITYSALYSNWSLLISDIK